MLIYQGDMRIKGDNVYKENNPVSSMGVSQLQPTGQIQPCYLVVYDP